MTDVTITISREDLADLARALRSAKEQALRDFRTEQTRLGEFQSRVPAASLNMLEASVRVAQNTFNQISDWSRKANEAANDGRRTKLAFSSKTPSKI